MIRDVTPRAGIWTWAGALAGRDSAVAAGLPDPAAGATVFTVALIGGATTARGSSRRTWSLEDCGRTTTAAIPATASTAEVPAHARAARGRARWTARRRGCP